MYSVSPTTDTREAIISNPNATHNLLVQLHNHRVAAAIAETASASDKQSATADGLLSALVHRNLTPRETGLMIVADQGLLEETDIEALSGGPDRTGEPGLDDEAAYEYRNAQEKHIQSTMDALVNYLHSCGLDEDQIIHALAPMNEYDSAFQDAIQEDSK